MLTNLLLTLGLNRDHWAFLLGKVVSIAALITTGVLDVGYWACDIGLDITSHQVHLVQVGAVVVLYLSGQYSTSQLPGERR